LNNYQLLNDISKGKKYIQRIPGLQTPDLHSSLTRYPFYKTSIHITFTLINISLLKKTWPRSMQHEKEKLFRFFQNPGKINAPKAEEIGNYFYG